MGYPQGPALSHSTKARCSSWTSDLPRPPTAARGFCSSPTPWSIPACSSAFDGKQAVRGPVVSTQREQADGEKTKQGTGPGGFSFGRGGKTRWKTGRVRARPLGWEKPSRVRGPPLRWWFQSKGKTMSVWGSVVSKQRATPSLRLQKGEPAALSGFCCCYFLGGSGTSWLSGFFLGMP